MIRYQVVYEIDEKFLCDQETIDEDFEGSWQKWMDWFAKEELGEVITGFNGLPVSIDVIKTPTPTRKKIK